MSSFLPASIQKLIEEFGRLPGIGPKSAQRLAMHLLHSPESRSRALSDAVGSFKKGLQFCSVCWNVAEESRCKLCRDAEAGMRNGRQICVVEEILDVVAIEKTLEYKGVYHVLHGALSPVDGIGPEQLKIAALVERVGRMAGGGGADEAGVAGEGGGKALDEMEATKSPLGQLGLQEPTFGNNFVHVNKSRMENEDAVSQPYRVADSSTSGTGIEVILATNPGLEGETTAMYLMRLLTPSGVRVTRIARGLPIGGDLDYADELTLTKAMEGRMEYK